MSRFKLTRTALFFVVMFAMGCRNGGPAQAVTDLLPSNPDTPTDAVVQVPEKVKPDDESSSGNGQGNDSGPKPPPSIPLKVIRSCAKPLPEGEVSLGKVTSLLLCPEVSGARPSSQVSIEVRTPSGVPYQRRDFTLQGALTDAQRVEFELPIAATLIDSSGLSGRWDATFFLNGDPIASERFDLWP